MPKLIERIFTKSELKKIVADIQAYERGELITIRHKMRVEDVCKRHTITEGQFRYIQKKYAHKV